MPVIEITTGGETFELTIDDRFEELLEEVNDALDRDMSLERFAAQRLRDSTTALEQSIERRIVHQHQAIREAEARGLELDPAEQVPGEGGKG